MSEQRAGSGGGYERTDVSVRSVAIFTTVLAVCCGFLMVLMVWLYETFERREARNDAATLRSTRLEKPVPVRPPEPVIQGAPGSRFELQDPLIEMEVHAATVEERLTTSGWVDRNANVVRIPVEHAKRLLLERGLPVRAAGSSSAEERR